MNQSGETKHDAELQKAFAEFKDSLRHAIDPAHDAAPKLEARIFDAPPATVRPAAPRIAPAPGPEKGATRGPETKIPAAAEAGRRRKLLYLSAAVVISGLAALGWTLTRGHGTNDPEIEASAPTAAESAETAAATLNPETDADPLQPTETATTDPATPATDAAPTQAESAAAPQSGTQATTAAVPQPATTPTIDSQTARAEPVTPPEAQKTVAPAVAAPAAATNAMPAKQAALAPATAPIEAEPAKTAAAAKPKAARPKTVAKPKPATQAARRPAPEAVPVAPPPAPVVAEAPPAPPPATGDGPFGFVKRTVNSMGSTLTNLGRSATGN